MTKPIMFIIFLFVSLGVSSCCNENGIYKRIPTGMKDWCRFNRNESFVFTSDLSNKDTLLVIDAIDTLETSGDDCRSEALEYRSAKVKLSSDTLFLFKVRIEENQIYFSTQEGSFRWDDSEKKFYENFSYNNKANYYKKATIDDIEYNSVFYIPARINGEFAILYYNREIGLFRFATLDKQIWRRN